MKGHTKDAYEGILIAIVLILNDRTASLVDPSEPAMLHILLDVEYSIVGVHLVCVPNCAPDST